MQEMQAEYEEQIANLEREKAVRSSALDREFMAQQEGVRELTEENRFLRNDIANLQVTLNDTELVIEDMKQEV